MAKSLNPEQIQDILECGSFDEFIGVVEDHQLECKKEPYQLQRDDQKQEFAKDVTALANVEGGFIRGCQDNCVTFFHTGTRSPNRITN
jgi:hypothetical protein